MNNQTETPNTKDLNGTLKTQADKATDKISQTAEKYGMDKDQIKGEADKLASEGSERLNAFVSGAKEQLGATGEKIAQGYGVATQELKAVGSKFEGVIRSNPLLAIGVAAGLGWAVGRFLTRSTSDRA